MDASVEWIAENIGLVRVHEAGGVYGDPWTFGCVVQRIGDDGARITLAQTAPTSAEHRAVRRLLESYGFTHATWERKNVKNERIVEVI